jgi:hypothetical protein
VRINIFHGEWAPVWNISSILISLRAFLGSPDTETAVEGMIADEVEERREEFERKDVEWTFTYAVGDGVRDRDDGDDQRVVSVPLEQEEEDDWWSAQRTSSYKFARGNTG